MKRVYHDAGWGWSDADKQEELQVQGQRATAAPLLATRMAATAFQALQQR
jgi:hypothetical protein